MSVQAEIPSICQHLENQTFSIPPAVRARYQLFPAEMQSGVALSHTFDFDVTVQVPAELSKLQASFLLTSVKLTAINDADFGFVDSAQLTLEGPDGSALAPTVISYEKTEAVPKVVTWKGAGLDLAPYLQSGSLRYAVTMVGGLPPTDLVVNVDACASAAFSLDYLKQ
jgi:hypothetical protein